VAQGPPAVGPGLERPDQIAGGGALPFLVLATHHLGVHLLLRFESCSTCQQAGRPAHCTPSSRCLVVDPASPMSSLGKGRADQLLIRLGNTVFLGSPSPTSMPACRSPPAGLAQSLTSQNGVIFTAAGGLFCRPRWAGFPEALRLHRAGVLLECIYRFSGRCGSDGEARPWAGRINQSDQLDPCSWAQRNRSIAEVGAPG